MQMDNPDVVEIQIERFLKESIRKISTRISTTTIDFQRALVNNDILSSTMLLHDNDIITIRIEPTSCVIHRCLWSIINHRHDTSMLIIGNNLHDIDEKKIFFSIELYRWMSCTLY